MGMLHIIHSCTDQSYYWPAVILLKLSLQSLSVIDVLNSHFMRSSTIAWTGNISMANLAYKQNSFIWTEAFYMGIWDFGTSPVRSLGSKSMPTFLSWQHFTYSAIKIECESGGNGVLAVLGIPRLCACASYPCEFLSADFWYNISWQLDPTLFWVLGVLLLNDQNPGSSWHSDQDGI